MFLEIAHSILPSALWSGQAAGLAKLGAYFAATGEDKDIRFAFRWLMTVYSTGALAVAQNTMSPT
jgi:hypothetical protein